LPSICEGSATSTYEALACGLPVIATPNTGSIVEDGVSGFIIPMRNVDAIVEKLELLCEPSNLINLMSQAASKLSSFGNLNQYATRLLQAVE